MRDRRDHIQSALGLLGLESPALPAAQGDALSLHLSDSLVWTLFASRLVVELLSEVLETNRAEASCELEALRQHGQIALTTFWGLRYDAEPDLLVGMPMGYLLRQLAQASTATGVLAVDLTVDGEPDLPPDVQVAFYQIAREALGRVAMQAGAARASISLRSQPGRTELAVGDYGSLGRAPIASICPALGELHSRARSVGASLSVDHHAGLVTRINLVWPGL